MGSVSRRKSLKKHRRFRRAKSKNWCAVYTLREFEDGPPRYVGQTRQSPDERLRWHMKEVARRVSAGEGLSPVQLWIASRLPAVPIMEVIDAEGIWDISEAVWIDRYSAKGHELLNVLSRVRRVA